MRMMTLLLRIVLFSSRFVLSTARNIRREIHRTPDVRQGEWFMPAADAGTGLCRSPHLLGSSHVRSEHGRRAHHSANRVQCIQALPPWRRQQLRRRCFAWPPVTSMTGAPWAKQFLPLLPFATVVGSVAVSSPSLKPVTTRIHP